MVDLVGIYSGAPFKGYLGFTQGKPLLPTILNMVVDAVIWHLVTLVSREEAGPEGFRQAVQWLA